jgi:hypothetical protein
VAELGHRGVGHALAVRLLCDVGEDAQRPPAGLLDHDAGLLEPVGPPCGQHNVGAGLSETLGEGDPSPDEAPVTTAILPSRENLSKMVIRHLTSVAYCG